MFLLKCFYINLESRAEGCWYIQVCEFILQNLPLKFSVARYKNKGLYLGKA